MRSRDQVGQKGQAMPSIVAVVSVVAMVVAMVAFLAAGGDDTAAEPQAEREASSPPASATPTTTGPQGPQTAAQAPPREQAKRADRRQDKKAKQRQQRQQRRQRQQQQQQQQQQQRAAPEAGAPDVYVEVYNNSSISGLAAQRAAELQDAGWQVIGVDNWFGDIPASTVYYPGGFEAEADALAETLGVDRVRAAVAPMKFDRLTVILTPDAA